MAKKDEKKAEAIELFKYCQAWYDEHETKLCYECGSRIMKYTKVHGHHLIPAKEQDKYNINIICNRTNLLLVCLGCHSKAETNNDFCPKIKAEEERIKKEFEQYLI